VVLCGSTTAREPQEPAHTARKPRRPRRNRIDCSQNVNLQRPSARQPAAVRLQKYLQNRREPRGLNCTGGEAAWCRTRTTMRRSVVDSLWHSKPSQYFRLSRRTLRRRLRVLPSVLIVYGGLLVFTPARSNHRSEGRTDKQSGGPVWPLCQYETRRFFNNCSKLISYETERYWSFINYARSRYQTGIYNTWICNTVRLCYDYLVWFIFVLHCIYVFSVLDYFDYVLAI